MRSQDSTERSWFKVSRFCYMLMKYSCDRRPSPPRYQSAAGREICAILSIISGVLEHSKCTNQGGTRHGRTRRSDGHDALSAKGTGREGLQGVPSVKIRTMFGAPFRAVRWAPPMAASRSSSDAEARNIIRRTTFNQFQFKNGVGSPCKSGRCECDACRQRLTLYPPVKRNLPCGMP